MTLETARNGAGLPDMSLSVRQVFGIDTDLEVPAYARPGGFAHRFAAYDPFGLFPERAAKTDVGTPERPLKRAERKCLRQLNLEDSATKADIKARFKELVKRLHPDHNEGDRSSEDKLREVIQAYNYLRQAGLA